VISGEGREEEKRGFATETQRAQREERRRVKEKKSRRVKRVRRVERLKSESVGKGWIRSGKDAV
jgi:hypothetical protein